VDDHAGRIDDASQRRPQTPTSTGDEVDLIVGAGEQLRSALGQLGSRHRDREPIH
jgi:hypothetical protein